MNRLSIYIVFALVLLGLVVRFILDDKERMVQQIQSNFEETLKAQKSDLNDFVDQFTIYSNPFDINTDPRFIKRVYVDGRLVYWSDNELALEYPQLHSIEGLYRLDHAGGTFVVRREVVSSQSSLIEIYSLLSLFNDPPITNQYLHRSINEEIFEDYEVFLNGSENLEYNSVRIPFSLNKNSIQWIDNSLFVLILLLLFLVLSSVRQNLLNKKQDRAVVGLALLVLARFIIWLVTRYGLEMHLFNPIYYTSVWAYSLGDLIINSLFVFAILHIISLKLDSFSRLGYWLVSILALALVHWFAYLVYRVTWNILENSLITLDVSQELSFDQFRVFAFVVLALWTAILFKAFDIGIDLISKYKKTKFPIMLIHVLLLAVIGYFIGNALMLVFWVTAVAWWIITLLKLSFDHVNLDYRAFLYTSLIIGLSALIGAYAVYRHYEKDELVAKRRFANRLLIKNDFLAEYYLNQRIVDIGNDMYIKSRLSNRLLVKRNIREKIRLQHLSTYFDKYEIDVFLFDENGNSLDNLELTYDSLRNEFAIDEYATDYPEIFFVEGKQDNVQDQYCTFIPITSFDRNVGFVVLSLSLKKYIPASVFPQLMVAGKYYISDEDRFDYAVFGEGKLLYKRSRYEFQNILDYPDLINPELFDKGIEKQDIEFFGLKTSEGRIYVIASPVYEGLAFVSNFSFLFLVILFCMAVIFWVAKAFDHEQIFNLSTKIQLYLGLSFVVPMLVVSLALLNSLNQSYKEEIDRNSNKKAYNISEQLIELLERFYNNEINRDDLNNSVSGIASLIQSDINIYTPYGYLLVSSEQEIFELGLLGRQIAPKPYNAVRYGNSENKVYKQSIGDLEFRVSILGLKSYRNGELLGILSLPYFDSRSHLQRQQVEVFNNLISIFTTIFLLSLVVGNLIIERLVKPLKLITERLKTTNLQETNTPIHYQSADEVGILINEYNQMILKLEESKAALAESQKESAWKEIARQVAHEIKNPLTPMRLKIQQMMRHKESDSQDYQVLNSLIGQIDALSSIADSFSAFAKMPAPKNEPFDIVGVIKEVVDVHSSDAVIIHLRGAEKAVNVNADRKIFNGIFNNIILNAIQATDAELVELNIDLQLKTKKILISIQDNGSGISEENRDKIFTPYFSTKARGSGIGLAVAKKGIENSGGSIWFESKVGEGTTFFISMPLVL